MLCPKTHLIKGQKFEKFQSFPQFRIGYTKHQKHLANTLWL